MARAWRGHGFVRTENTDACWFDCCLPRWNAGVPGAGVACMQHLRAINCAADALLCRGGVGACGANVTSDVASD
eukprot:gene13485-biopygen6518